MERRRVGGKVVDFLKRRRAESAHSAPKVPQIIQDGQRPIDFTQLRIDTARATLHASTLSKEQQGAIEQLVAGERERAHIQTDLSWQLALSAPEARLDLDEVQLGRIRDIQEEFYQITSTMGVTYTNLEELEGRRDLD